MHGLDRIKQKNVVVCSVEIRLKVKAWVGGEGGGGWGGTALATPNPSWLLSMYSVAVLLQNACGGNHSTHKTCKNKKKEKLRKRHATFLFPYVLRP